MSTVNRIGLDAEKSKHEAEMLNDLLANYSVFYQNTRGYHWNIRGEQFFELHEIFEELYNDLFEKIDDVAERVLTLGYTPEHRYENYLKVSEVKESSEVNDGKKAVQQILEAFQIILAKQRKLLDYSDEMKDEGTNALMSDYISEQEKKVWMYSAYLNK
jgi:starvation-inducible DNA-binding protein